MKLHISNDDILKHVVDYGPLALDQVAADLSIPNVLAHRLNASEVAKQAKDQMSELKGRLDMLVKSGFLSQSPGGAYEAGAVSEVKDKPASQLELPFALDASEQET